jgi:hypothetical protein
VSLENFTYDQQCFRHSADVVVNGLRHSSSTPVSRAGWQAEFDGKAGLAGGNLTVPRPSRRVSAHGTHLSEIAAFAGRNSLAIEGALGPPAGVRRDASSAGCWHLSVTKDRSRPSTASP